MKKQVKKDKKPVLTSVHKKAGIVSVGSRNLNGSYNCLVVLDRISIDSNASNYRSTLARHILEIVQFFWIKAMRNPLLNYNTRTKELDTIDGRHSIRVLLRKKKEAEKHNKDFDYDVIPCDVFFGLQPHVAARVFWNITEQSMRMSKWSSFYAALVAKMDFALDIKSCFEKYNLMSPVDHGVPPSRGSDISCVEPFIEVAMPHKRLKGTRKSHLDDLCYILGAFRDDNGKGATQPIATSNPFLRGLIDILRTTPYTRKHIRDCLSDVSAQEIQNYARGIAPGERANRNHYRQAFEAWITEKQARFSGTRLRKAA